MNWFQVIRTAGNAESIVKTQDRALAISEYDSRDNVILMELVGRDSEGELIPNVAGDNLMLAMRMGGNEVKRLV